MNNPTSALDAVRNYQTQVDEDGTLIGVSRQALDEVITDYDALAARLADALRIVNDNDQWEDCGARISLRAVLTDSAPEVRK